MPQGRREGPRGHAARQKSVLEIVSTGEQHLRDDEFRNEDEAQRVVHANLPSIGLVVSSDPLSTI